MIPATILGLTKSFGSLGRGQDAEALTRFIGTIAQTLGPEALMKYVDATEAIKRLAAAQGIDVLNLIKSPETMEAEMQQQQQMAAQQGLIKQAGSIASSPLMDPTKNPQGLSDSGILPIQDEEPPTQ